MNKFTKIACVAIAASILLFACDISGDDESSSQYNTSAIVCTVDVNPTKCYACAEGILKCASVEKPPYDSAIIIIGSDVKEWLEEQLTYNGNEKKMITIIDMYLPETISQELSTINKTSENEEYYRTLEEYRKPANADKRPLSIPGIVYSGDSKSWTVLMTAAEVEEVIKKYNNLAIEFYIEFIPMID